MEVLHVSTSDDLIPDLDAHHDDDSPLGGRVIVVESSPGLNFERCEDKAHDVRECLLLHGDNSSSSSSTTGTTTVDLWELRQLALSPGGLLSPSLRRVAWPLLTGISGTNLEDNSNNKNNNILEESLAKTLQNDVETNIWNVEELVKQSQAGKESFWYAPVMQSNPKSTSTTRADHQDAPGMILASPCSISANSYDESTTNGSLQKHSTTTASPPPSKDFILIQTVINKALTNEDQTEYPVSGLANLAALLTINLESTNLASLLLSRLIQYPLKAADITASSSNLKSLEQVLRRLLPHKKCKMNDLSDATNWFAGTSDTNLQTASRLIDACLVSHPLFPLYFGTAVAAASTDFAWTMEAVEESITKALEYMEQLPPTQLLSTANISSSLPPTPIWAIAATATADWVSQTPPLNAAETENCNLQQNEPFSDEATNSNWERLSTASTIGEEVDDNNAGSSLAAAPSKATLFREAYPLAMTAAGLGLPTRTTTSRSLQLPFIPSSLSSSSSKGRRYLRLVFLLSAIVTVLLSVWSKTCYTGGTVRKASTPIPVQEKFLGLVPVHRSAPKKVLRMAAPRPVHREKILGFVPIERPAPKKVLRTVTSMSSSTKKTPSAPTAVPQKMTVPPKKAPTSAPPPRPMVMAKHRPTLVPALPKAKWTFMMRLGQATRKMSNESPPASEQLLQKYLLHGFPGMGLEEYVASTVQALGEWKASMESSSNTTTTTEQEETDAIVAPVARKFQPLLSLKKHLQKAGKLWAKVVTFFRNRRPRRRGTANKKEP